MNWNDLDAKAQCKALILAAFIVIALLALFWPAARPGARIIPRRLPPASGPQSPKRMPEPQPHPQPASPPPAKDAGMLGRWQSGALPLPKRGICSLWMDVSRNTQDANKYTGAATLNCSPMIAPASTRREAILRRNSPMPQPVATTLTGALEKDTIVFKVDKLFNGGECGINGLSVSRFGSQYLAAELHDACGGGSAVMHKAR